MAGVQTSELLAEAQAAPTKGLRSKLDAHWGVIAELRKKHWTFADIAAWLKERGIEASASNVHRFYHVAKKQAKPIPPQTLPADPVPASPSAPPKRKRRFNLPI